MKRSGIYTQLGHRHGRAEVKICIYLKNGVTVPHGEGSEGNASTTPFFIIVYSYCILLVYPDHGKTLPFRALHKASHLIFNSV